MKNGYKKKGSKETENKASRNFLMVERKGTFSKDLKVLTRHFGLKNESGVTRMVIKEKANSIKGE